MPHFSEQFSELKKYAPTLLSDSYAAVNDWKEVRDCMGLSIADTITFQQWACATLTDVKYGYYTWIRPAYKFYQGMTGRPQFTRKCYLVMQPDVNSDAVTNYYEGSNPVTYASNNIEYMAFPNVNNYGFSTEYNPHVYTKCWGQKSALQGVSFESKPLESSTILYEKKIQPVNVKTTRTSSQCPDFVSEACFQNVYAFYARPCTWVDKTKTAILFFTLKDYMIDLTQPNKDKYWERFRVYGDGLYDVDLSGSKLRVYINNVVQSNGKVMIQDGDTIQIKPENGYSCGGCDEMSGSQYQGIAVDFVNEIDFANSEDVPLRCKLCLPSEAVTSGYFPRKKNYKRCTQCPKHEIRSPNTPSECVLCISINETLPMRVVAKKHEKCMPCMHVQHFDEKEDEGCIYYVSVSDFITFGAGGLPVFTSIANKSPRDEFSEKGVKPLLEVEAKHYRILNIGTVWTASSNRSVCTYNAEEVINSTTSNLTNATRNTGAKRLYYRKWCGHHEIIRQRNALLRKQQILPMRMNFIIVTLQEITSNCTGAVTVLKKNEKEVMPDNRVAEFKCENQTHKFLYEIRREGQEVQCTVCAGTSYTKQCWPTYHPSMSTVDDEYFSKVNTPSPGTCDQCVKRCDATDNFLKTSLFSCWSNGTERISGEDHGRLDYLEKRAALHMNYWYKEADCSTCPSLDGIAVRRPALVTRCGNKESFDIWHPAEVLYIDGVAQPTVRVCCSLVRFNSGGIFDVNLDAWCFQTHDIAKLNCESTIPDLATETAPYCPPGWFVDETCAKDKENVDVWTPQCCLKCHACSLGLVKTPQYQDCPGDTFYDTQTFGCKAECLSGNYLDGDTCIPCETCMR